MDLRQKYLEHVPEAPANDVCLVDNPVLHGIARVVLRDDPNAALLDYWSEAEAVSYIDNKIG